MLRNGARALLAQAVEAEASALLASHADKLTEDGRQRLVRHGHLPEREVMTGIGPVAVRCPRVRDRVGEGSERIRFSSAILPPYARRSKSLEVLIPILYLKGISTGEFEEALAALLGKDAGGLSATTIGRLKEAWSEEQARAGTLDELQLGSARSAFARGWVRRYATNPSAAYRCPGSTRGTFPPCSIARISFPSPGQPPFAPNWLPGAFACPIACPFDPFS